MNNFLLAISFSCFSLLTSIGNNLSENVYPLKKDLFDNPGNIKASWLGYLQSAKANKSINNVPMFVYKDEQSTYAKIICVPTKPVLWNTKFKGKNIPEKISISKTLTQGIINHSFGEKNFIIYAFVQQSDNVNSFPATIYIYRNTGKKWNPVSQKKVNNAASYQQLQYDVADIALAPEKLIRKL
ncbi:hypothetical protein [Pedobacter aquatilis]|uniref:hypothetical protein n=1 Tax=Pedobacter aquatilis TaxID=351343 RepID=UPI002930DBFB|nr:hypothetical protein [Pedobacter aquatilis]